VSFSFSRRLSFLATLVVAAAATFAGSAGAAEFDKYKL
jgi:hypothetical protein